MNKSNSNLALWTPCTWILINGRRQIQCGNHSVVFYKITEDFPIYVARCASHMILVPSSSETISEEEYLAAEVLNA